MKKAIVAYIPVVSRAYIEMLEQGLALGAEKLVLPDIEITQAIPSLRKDIRALDSGVVKKIIESTFGTTTAVYGIDDIKSDLDAGTNLILPNDDVTEYILSAINIPPDRYEIINLFLRWFRGQIDSESDNIFSVVDIDTIPEHIITELHDLQARTIDWWRSVGCVIADGEETIITRGYNHYLPAQYSAELDCDMRSQSRRGQDIELSNAQHAEASAIAFAARNGLKLDGSSLYVTTFPCPLCAKLIAESGVKRIYFGGGYAVSDGELILKSSGIDIFKIRDWEDSKKVTTKPVSYF